MRKPKVGEFYKVFKDRGLELYNVIKILKVDDYYAYYTCMDQVEELCRTWDYKKFPECLDQKISYLEMELI